MSVLGNTTEIDFGFPELKFKGTNKGTVFVDEHQSMTKSGTNRSISVHMKGFYTWDEKDYGLDKNQLTQGLYYPLKVFHILI